MRHEASALDITKNNGVNALKELQEIKLSAREAALPKPPGGTSTARELQDPDHVDLVKARVNVPSAEDMALEE